jgi:hypothetical protein
MQSTLTRSEGGAHTSIINHNKMVAWRNFHARRGEYFQRTQDKKQSHKWLNKAFKIDKRQR